MRSSVPQPDGCIRNADPPVRVPGPVATGDVLELRTKQLRFARPRLRDSTINRPVPATAPPRGPNGSRPDRRVVMIAPVACLAPLAIAGLLMAALSAVVR